MTVYSRVLVDDQRRFEGVTWRAGRFWLVLVRSESALKKSLDRWLLGYHMVRTWATGPSETVPYGDAPVTPSCGRFENFFCGPFKLGESRLGFIFLRIPLIIITHTTSRWRWKSFCSVPIGKIERDVSLPWQQAKALPASPSHIIRSHTWIWSNNQIKSSSQFQYLNAGSLLGWLLNKYANL